MTKPGTATEDVVKGTGHGTILNDDVHVSVEDGSAIEGNPVGFRRSLTDATGQNFPDGLAAGALVADG